MVVWNDKEVFGDGKIFDFIMILQLLFYLSPLCRFYDFITNNGIETRNNSDICTFGALAFIDIVLLDRAKSIFNIDHINICFDMFIRFFLTNH